MKRNLSIDAVKIVAMFGVIALHTFGEYQDILASRALYETAVVSIPLFFTVSGFLLLGKDTLTYKYIISKIWKIIRFILFISISYCVLHFLIERENIVENIWVTFSGAFIMKGPFWMCWYLGVTILLYLFAPIAHNLLYKHKAVYMSIFLSFLLVEFVIFSLNVKGYGGGNFENGVVQPLRIWNWLFYFLAGGFLNSIVKKTVINSILCSMPATMMLLLIFGNIFFQEVFREAIKSNLCEYFYSSLITITFVVIIFIYFLSRNIAPNGFWGKIIKELSALFLPVYIFHYFVVVMAQHYIHNTTFVLQPFVLFLIVSVLTLSISFVIVRIPVVNWLFRL